MNRLMIATLLMSAAGTPAMSQTPAAPPVAKPMGTCEALAADWKRYEQNMASRWADRLGDNSAPRATLAEMREANDLSMAAMTLQFMRDNKCALPKRAPSVGTYLSAALACSTAQIKAGAGVTPPECNRETWQAK